MTATIDILIPAYNAGRFIRTTLDSIIAQTERDFRVVLIDDGSTDDTGAICDAFAAADPRITVHHQINAGIVDALNAGLALCTAAFVGRIDADDIAYPDRFERQIAFMRANPDVVALGCAVRHIDASGNPVGTIARFESPENADPYWVPSREPYLIHPFLCARRAALIAIGGYRHVHHAEDTDLYWRLRGQGRLVNTDEVLGEYRLHDASISGSSVMNARIMSVNSQLTSIAEQRRLDGRPDIAFDRGSIDVYKRAGTLAAMIDVARVSLDTTEAAWLRLAVAAKMIEVTGYRPFECDADDCAFIGATARAGFGHMVPANRRILHRSLAGTAARLAVGGRMGDALALLPLRLYPSFAARYLSRALLPPRLAAMLRRRQAKAMPFKSATV